MDLSFITNNSIIIGVILVIGFCVWKFIIQPIANEGQPIPEVEGDSPSQE